MNSARKLLVLAAVLSLTVASHATVITSWADFVGLITTFNGSLTVGNIDPTAGNCIPLLCNTTNFYVNIPVSDVDYQQVYAASAFAGPMSISSLAFYYDAARGGSSLVISGTYSVYLSTTSAAVNALDGVNLANNRGPDWTWFGTLSAGTDTNPSITLSGTPFSYDPANGNLLVEIFGTGQIVTGNVPGVNGYMEVDTDGIVMSRAAEYSAILPEPGTLLMFGSGLVALAGLVRRKLML
jgi:PEP-CTERM motif